MTSTTPLNSPPPKPVAGKGSSPAKVKGATLPNNTKFSFKAAFQTASSTPAVSRLPLRARHPPSTPASEQPSIAAGKKRQIEPHAPLPPAEFGGQPAVTMGPPVPLSARSGSLLSNTRTISSSPSGKIARSESLRDVHDPTSIASSTLVRPSSRPNSATTKIGSLAKTRPRTAVSGVSYPKPPPSSTSVTAFHSAPSVAKKLSSPSLSRSNTSLAGLAQDAKAPAKNSSPASAASPSRPHFVRKRSDSAEPIKKPSTTLTHQSKGSAQSPQGLAPRVGKADTNTTRAGPPPSFPFPERARPDVSSIRKKRSSLPAAPHLMSMLPTPASSTDRATPPASQVPPRSNRTSPAPAETPAPAAKAAVVAPRSNHIRADSLSSLAAGRTLTATTALRRPDLGIHSSVMKANPITNKKIQELQKVKPHEPISTPEARMKGKKRLSGLSFASLQFGTPGASSQSSSDQSQTCSKDISSFGFRFPAQRDASPPKESEDDTAKMPETLSSDEIDAGLKAHLDFMARKANLSKSEIERRVQEADRQASEAREAKLKDPDNGQADQHNPKPQDIPVASQSKAEQIDSATLSPVMSVNALRSITPSLSQLNLAELSIGGESELLGDMSVDAAGDQSLDMKALTISSSTPLRTGLISPSKSGSVRRGGQAARIKRALRQSVGFEAIQVQPSESLLGIEFDGIGEELDAESVSPSPSPSLRLAQLPGEQSFSLDGLVEAASRLRLSTSSQPGARDEIPPVAQEQSVPEQDEAEETHEDGSKPSSPVEDVVVEAQSSPAREPAPPVPDASAERLQEAEARLEAANDAQAKLARQLRRLQVDMLDQHAREAATVKRMALVEIQELRSQADSLLFMRYQLETWERMAKATAAAAAAAASESRDDSVTV